MYSQLATKLAVNQGADQYSQAVAMEGSNAARLDATVFNLGGATSLTIDIQGSNDQENWTQLQNNTGLVLGYSSPDTKTGIGFAYIRLRYSVVGAAGDVVILAAGVNTSLQ